MSRPMESEIAAQILRKLRGHGLMKFILVGDSKRDDFEQGHPQLIGSCKGHTVLIQVLRPGESLSELQFRRVEEWRRSGADVVIGPDWFQIRDRLVEFGHMKMP